MRYPNFPGVAKRILDRLVALGYVTEDGKPDRARFLKEHHYDPRNFYAWTNEEQDRTPSDPYLTRLAADLETTRSFLLFGEESAALQPRPIAGGSDNDGTPNIESLLLRVPLIRRWLSGLLWPPRLCPQFA